MKIEQCGMDILVVLDRLLGGDARHQGDVLAAIMADDRALCRRSRAVLEAEATALVPRLRHFILTEASLLLIEVAAMVLPYCGRAGTEVIMELLEHEDRTGVAFAAACGVGEFSPADAWTVPLLHAFLERQRIVLRMYHELLARGLAGIGPCVPHEPMRQRMMEWLTR